MVTTSYSPIKAQLRRLGTITPTEFENLIYDLAVQRGMVNVAWRTPGADGGRDIEAQTVQKDFSGTQTIQKWFIECKRYTGSVDWPTIYGKLAYADSLGADYLLMCTASKFTPTAITHMDQWNLGRRGVTIRLWPGHEIESQLKQHPDLSLKYGLSSAPTTPGRSIVSLALALSKSVASHGAETVFKDLPSDAMLQAAQAIADLLVKRMEDLSIAGHIRLRFVQVASDALEGCQFKGDFSHIDEFGIRAFAAYLYALTRTPLQLSSTGNQNCEIERTTTIDGLLDRYRDTFSSIAVWSNAEINHSHNKIYWKQRQ